MSDQDVIVGAYAASPTNAGWDPAVETALYDGLASIASVRGVELPWHGSLHPHDDAWLVANLRPEWDVVYTDIQSTARPALADAAFGLASDDEAGRRRALDVTRGLWGGTRSLADQLGRDAVAAVEIHTQPRRLGGGAASAAALTRSLEEILGWDWGRTVVLVEHCDAAVEGRETPKGYLSLAEEVDALAAFDGHPGLGLEINWGRSAIELRDGDRVVDQIIQARESGFLRSLFYSGVSDQDGPFGAAWDDAHPPFAPAPGFTTFEPTSILTHDRAAAARVAAGPVEFLGLKIGNRPVASPVESVLALLTEAVQLVADLPSQGHDQTRHELVGGTGHVDR